ncbi:MAG: hypothetical protein ACOYD6_02010 [Limnochordia bacterium]|jgi:hypothetical protein
MRRYLTIGLILCFILIFSLGALAQRDQWELSITPIDSRREDLMELELRIGSSSQAWIPRLVYSEKERGGDIVGAGVTIEWREMLGLLGYRSGVGTGSVRWREGQGELEVLGLDYNVVVGNRQGGALVYYAGNELSSEVGDLPVRDPFNTGFGAPWEERQGHWGWELDGRVRQSRRGTVLWETGWRQNIERGHSETFIGSGLELRDVAKGKLLLGSRFIYRQQDVGWLTRLSYEEKFGQAFRWVSGLSFESWGSAGSGTVFSSLWHRKFGDWVLGIGGRIPLSGEPVGTETLLRLERSSGSVAGELSFGPGEGEVSLGIRYSF